MEHAYSHNGVEFESADPVPRLDVPNHHFYTVSDPLAADFRRYFAKLDRHEMASARCKPRGELAGARAKLETSYAAAESSLLDEKLGAARSSYPAGVTGPTPSILVACSNCVALEPLSLISGLGLLGRK
jgi:hypothetical protein